jgi:4-carboxymuconolactone decarboxylase
MKMAKLMTILIVMGLFVRFWFDGSVLAQQLLTQGSGPAAEKTAALPKDVSAESLNRLPLVKREQLDERAQKIYDAYADPNTRSLAGLQGPGGIRLHSPRIAEYDEPLNRYLRNETGIPRRLTELAILVTAREFGNQFEWAAHEPAALKEGLEANIIDVVKHRKESTHLGDKEAAIISIGRELFGKRNLSSATYARGLALFGEKGMVDLVYLMTQYAATSYLLRAFDMQLHPGQRPLLPIR